MQVALTTLEPAAGAVFRDGPPIVKTLIALLLWCALLLLCWPLAFLALLLWPVVWLLSLPFRLVGITCSAAFAVLAALLTLPARLLGSKPAGNGHAMA